ncbi:MAG: PDZ domain-containing protein [Lewinellaceae bacterium]|nr:PDZ domain-containing protein [Lewinellaceae bacterium]
MKFKWTFFLALAVLLPGLLLAQDKPEKSKKSKQKIVVIKKSVDEDGNEVVEKIVREGKDGETLEWQDENGNVIIKLGNGDAEWQTLDGDDIDIDIESLNDLDIELEKHLEGLDGHLRNIDIELDELDGLKNMKVIVEPDGEVFEWQGRGGLPEELKNRLENKGLHFRSLDGEDFTFGAPPNKAMLGVQVGQKIERLNESGDVEDVDVPESEGAAVMEVFEGSAAEEAGIRKGDIITAVDGQPIEGFKALVDALSDKEPGEKVVVGLNREGQPMEVEATLKGRDNAPAVYEFRTDDDGHNIYFFDDDDDGDSDERHHRVIILKDEDDGGEGWDVEAPEVEKPALELDAFEAFPNPADNQLTVRFSGRQAPVTVMLLDASGQQVYKEYIKDFTGKYDQQIGLEGIPEGFLLLTVEQEGKIFTEKLMIARQ